MANTPNRGYPLQVTGTNVGIWGTVVNNNILSVLDNNLGGTLPINVGGSSNINLTAAQAQNLIHDLTGVLTGNIQYIFPATGGFYTVNNQTTGAFTVTIAVVGGGSTVVAIQGGATNVTIDAIGLNVLTQSQATTAAAAGTLTGTTLASNVVNSSLTGVATITSGIWNGTTIAVANGGTGAVTLPLNNLIAGNGTSAPNFIAPGATGNILTSNGTSWTSTALSSAVPPGALLAYAGSSAPSGYLLCFGQAISRTTFAALFAAISTNYGIGDGSTTFNVPDLRGNVPAGSDNMGGSAAGRLTSTTMSPDGQTLSAAGGAQTHTLTVAEIPPPTFTIASGQVLNSATTGIASADITSLPKNISGITTNYGGGAHINVQPTIIVNYIIKT